MGTAKSDEISRKTPEKLVGKLRDREHLFGTLRAVNVGDVYTSNISVETYHFVQL